jgi:hypothetical protein
MHNWTMASVGAPLIEKWRECLNPHQRARGRQGRKKMWTRPVSVQVFVGGAGNMSINQRRKWALGEGQRERTDGGRVT